MFYQPKDGHGLPHNPFNAIVTPRPIGWISTRGKNGVNNLAPYSFFNAVAYEPPQVMFSSTGRKDSVANIEETGVFCVNIVEYAMRQVMNHTSVGCDPEVDEFDMAGIERADCEMIECARVANGPASLECRLTQIVKLKGATNFTVFGEVVGIFIRDNTIVDGVFDVTTFNPLARLGYMDYAKVDTLFSIERPKD